MPEAAPRQPVDHTSPPARIGGPDAPDGALKPGVEVKLDESLNTQQGQSIFRPQSQSDAAAASPGSIQWP